MRKIRILAAMSIDGLHVPLKIQQLCNFHITACEDLYRDTGTVLTTAGQYKAFREIELNYGKPVYICKKDTSLVCKDGITGNKPLTIQELEKQGGDAILILGNSRELITTLLNNNRVDEIILCIFPVILGKGKRIFPALPDYSLWKIKKRQLHDSGMTVIHFYIQHR